MIKPASRCLFDLIWMDFDMLDEIFSHLNGKLGPRGSGVAKRWAVATAKFSESTCSTKR